jgi:hypothetical protein
VPYFRRFSAHLGTYALKHIAKMPTVSIQKIAGGRS